MMMMMMMMERGGGGGGGEERGSVSRGMLPLVALHAVNEYNRSSSDRKPLVTSGLVVANTLIYLNPAVLRNILPNLAEVCFIPYLILKHRDLRRFFMSAFYHVGEPHIVYNMMSLIGKGIPLETSMGSVEFASMIAALVGMSQGVTLLLSKSLLLFSDYERAYYYQPSVGFSGVLFAMKVVLNSQSDKYANVMGIVVPARYARYAVWTELILVQMSGPRVSFLGHLGGILAGILYLRLKGSYPGPDPLTAIIRGVTGVLSWALKLSCDFFRFGRRRTSDRGTVGGSQTGRTISDPWRCAACSCNSSELLNACEMCGTGRGNNELSSTHPSTQRSRGLSSEELRLRRIESAFYYFLFWRMER